jgi:hypothetical protein
MTLRGIFKVLIGVINFCYLIKCFECIFYIQVMDFEIILIIINSI